MKVSVGRIVHYQRAELEGPLAALVVAVEEESVHLMAWTRDGTSHFLPVVHFSEEPKAGCWNWPPRVE